MEQHVLGIDIGGTTISFGLVNSAGKIFHRHGFTTKDFHGFISFAQTLYDYVNKEGILNQIQAIGIGAPNGNFFTGCIDYAPNLNWGEHIAVVDIVKEIFGLPVWLSNDANAAACGEKQYGGAKSMQDFAVITLGTGVGSGFYVDGKLMQGKFGNAGEFGHIIVEEDGRLCGCGRKGCLETYSSVSGLILTVKELLRQEQESVLYSLPELNGKVIADAARQGDQLATKAFEITNQYLGKALANLVTLFDPEAIFLLGGLAQSADLIVPSTKNIMEENLMSLFKSKVTILESQLADADAAILGAAAIAKEQL